MRVNKKRMEIIDGWCNKIEVFFLGTVCKKCLKDISRATPDRHWVSMSVSVNIVQV